MKKGNDCHKCYVGVMGNAQKIGHHPVFIKVGEATMAIPVDCLKKDGTIKKRYLPVIQALRANRQRVAA